MLKPDAGHDRRSLPHPTRPASSRMPEPWPSSFAVAPNWPWTPRLPHPNVLDRLETPTSPRRLALDAHDRVLLLTVLTGFLGAGTRRSQPHRSRRTTASSFRA